MLAVAAALFSRSGLDRIALLLAVVRCLRRSAGLPNGGGAYSSPLRVPRPSCSSRPRRSCHY